MPFVLLVDQRGRTQRFPLKDGCSTVGSEPEADVRIHHLSVSRRHALLHVSPEGVDVEDLGSSNGTRHGNGRIRSRTRVSTGVPLLFGAATTLVEEYESEDGVVGIALPSQEVGPEIDRMKSGRATTTLSPTVLESFAFRLMPDLLARISSAEDPKVLIQAVAEGLFRCLPCTSLELLHVHREREAIVFSAARDLPGSAESETQVVETPCGAMTLRVLFSQPTFAEVYEPLVRAGGDLVAICERLAGRIRPALAGGGSLGKSPRLPDPLSVSPIVSKIYADASRVAASLISVLIQGESGTGKEVIARFVHEASSRSEGPLVTLNCAAVPRDLLEAELFGVEGGVATGVESRPGRFELAHGGTLFLDEIGDMSLETQARILRVLQEKEVYRIGGRKARPADARILSATNQNLEEMLSDGSFRSDLYHRIADWVVDLPPLRSRTEDIPNLAAYFLGRSCEARALKVAGISRAALQALSSYSWPGNIRQLEKEMARAAIFLEDGDLLDTSRLTPSITESGESPAKTLKEILEQAERRAMTRALSACNGDAGAAARYLGIGRSTMYRRLTSLGIEH